MQDKEKRVSADRSETIAVDWMLFRKTVTVLCDTLFSPVKHLITRIAIMSLKKV